MISVDNPAMLNAIDNILSSLVDMHLGDPMDLAKEVGRMLLGDTLDEEQKERLFSTVESK